MGTVYTFGNGAYYKLGHGDDEHRSVPTRVETLEGVGAFQLNGTTSGVKAIACGVWHTVVVANGTNDVYGWGWNKFGNLGRNPEDVRGGVEHVEEVIALPRRIEELDDAHLLGEFGGEDAEGGDAEGEDVCQVTCGSRHTALRTASGRVIVM
jgi:alpha-tubulin suppressor-like RCC1 family protein